MKNLTKFYKSLTYDEKTNLHVASFLTFVFLFSIGLVFYPVRTFFILLIVVFISIVIYFSLKVYQFYKFVKEENAQ